MIKYFCDRCEQEAKDICKECLTVNDCVKEECKWHWIIKALEKQIPKTEFCDMGQGWSCPTCGALTGRHFAYCPECGQRLE
jgi:hypothetical protein